jgi:predicted CXXCH cytochrome family protein
VLLLFAMTPIVTAAAVEPTPVREADAVCARCHAEIFQSYLATPMANASGPAMEKLRPGSFVHTSSGTEYTITAHDDRAELFYRSLHGQDNGGQRRLTYFLGSGHLGTTYLYSIGDFLFESPVAWYAPSRSYDMKPGLAELKFMPPALPMQSGCLRCHMSSVQPSDPGTINRYQGLPFLHASITCEACHGEAGEHAKSGKGEVANPARLSADRRDSICINCHLEGDVSIKRAGKSALNYRPGEPISDYLAFYVRAGANLTDRAVSEVEQLSQSRCKRMSGDRMSCMSCHDPHYSPDASHSVAFYRSKCLACHSQTEFAKTHHPENQDCTSCHMPRSGARNILHVAWTDHRIRKRPEPMHEPSLPESGELTPIFSPGTTERDQAMAEYQALLEGDRSRESAVWKQLTALEGHLGNDDEALDALGNIAAERGDLAGAERAFKRVLDHNPIDLTALSNLGVLLAKEGKLQESEAILQKAFDRNQDSPALAMNLARVQCIAGNGAAARSTLTTALVYCPGDEPIQRLLTQLADCGAAGAK